MSISHMDLPHRGKLSPQMQIMDVDKLIDFEKEKYGYKSLDANIYKAKLNNYLWVVDNLLKLSSNIFLFHHASPAIAVIKKMAIQLNKNIIRFERWFAPGSYVFNSAGLWINQMDNTSTQYAKENTALLKDLLKARTLKYNSANSTDGLPDKYILFLGGQSSGIGYGLKSAEEYSSIGHNWGRDIDVIPLIEKIIESRYPDYKLLIRQHPYDNPRVKEIQAKKGTRILASDKSMEDLIVNAKVVLTRQTGMVYHSIALNRKPIILGEHELSGTDLVAIVYNETDLADAINDAMMAESIAKFLPKDSILPYFNRHVWVNDAPFTYKKIEQMILAQIKAPSTNTWHKLVIEVKINRQYSRFKRKVVRFIELIKGGKKSDYANIKKIVL